MSVAQVLRLEDYRGRRIHRLRLADRLYSADPGRLAVFRHLVEVAELCDADRAATVWVDEYGPSSVHPHVVLDHVADRPRRIFSSELLRTAWELGVPGAIDVTAGPESSFPTTFAISLGSDGMRAWFLVAESSGSRPLLSSGARDRLMFLAGECAAVLLHRDLDAMLPAQREEPTEAGFAGWPILKDLEGRESDEEEGRRIARRFVVGRVVRMLVDEDLVSEPTRIVEQVRRARVELPATWDPDDEEAALWQEVLDALDRGDLAALAGDLVKLGRAVERRQHTHGALELYDCAYQIATGIASARSAAEAAWHSGRVHRRRAAWDEARAKYATAQAIAEVAGLTDMSVSVAVGLAMLKQDLGNFPAARTALEEALSQAEGSGAPDSIALVHHSLMGLEQLAGNVVQSLEHGWIAVATYQDAGWRTEVMASLAGVLVDFGDRSAAEDAWTLVAHESRDRFFLTYAHDALAHLAALRGDEATFQEHAARCDALDWDSGSTWAKAEILYHRGASYRALGQLERADEWLRAALSFAEEHGYGRLVFRAEQALEDMSDPQTGSEPDTGTSPAAPAEIREGLRSMRRELVGVGA